MEIYWKSWRKGERRPGGSSWLKKILSKEDLILSGCATLESQILVGMWKNVTQHCTLNDNAFLTSLWRMFLSRDESAQSFITRFTCVSFRCSLIWRYVAGKRWSRTFFWIIHRVWVPPQQRPRQYSRFQLYVIFLTDLSPPRVEATDVIISVLGFGA